MPSKVRFLRFAAIGVLAVAGVVTAVVAPSLVACLKAGCVHKQAVQLQHGQKALLNEGWYAAQVREKDGLSQFHLRHWAHPFTSWADVFMFQWRNPLPPDRESRFPRELFPWGGAVLVSEQYLDPAIQSLCPGGDMAVLGDGRMTLHSENVESMRRAIAKFEPLL